MQNTPENHLFIEERLINLTDEMMRTLVMLRGIICTLENDSDIIRTLRRCNDTASIDVYESVTSMLYLLLERYEGLRLTYSTGRSTPE